MKISTSERKFLLESMQKLLEEYNYEYGVEHLNAIIDEWASKKERLIEAFKRHPKYVDGKFMIVFDFDYERSADKKSSDVFSNYLRYRVITDHKFIEALPPEINLERLRDGCSYLPDRLYSFLTNLVVYAESKVSSTTAEIINQMIPELKIREGTKTSRAINKICTYLGYDKHEDYNKEFAKYADSLNPLVVRRHTVLSINPLDYLTMSFGNSWSSCHSIDKNNKRGLPRSYRGEFSSGTLSYMLDETSMVLYTVDKSYNGNDYWNQPKINRQMFHYGEDKLVQGRLYPQDNDVNPSEYEPYRNLVQEIMSIIFGFPNLWKLNKDSYYIKDHTTSYGTHYRDYVMYKNCTISTIKDTDNQETVAIGADPICIMCGERHNFSNNISCCARYVTCKHCGNKIDSDNAIYVNDEPYCEDCVYWCDMCEEYHVGDNYHYIEDEDLYVCDSCFNEYFSYCDKCNKLERASDLIYIGSEDVNICRECFDDHYDYCIECGEYHHNDNMRQLENGTMVCESCYKKQEGSELKNEEEA